MFHNSSKIHQLAAHCPANSHHIRAPEYSRKDLQCFHLENHNQILGGTHSNPWCLDTHFLWINGQPESKNVIIKRHSRQFYQAIFYHKANNFLFQLPFFCGIQQGVSKKCKRMVGVIIGDATIFFYQCS